MFTCCWELSIAHRLPPLPCSYLFTYLDASPSRPSLEALLDEYWRRMPEYQGVQLEDLQASNAETGHVMRAGACMPMPKARSSAVGSAVPSGFPAATSHMHPGHRHSEHLRVAFTHHHRCCASCFG